MNKEELAKLDRECANLLGIFYTENNEGIYVIFDGESLPRLFNPTEDRAQWAELLERFHIQLGVNNDMTWWASPVDEFPGKIGLTPGIAVVKAVIAAEKT